MTLLMMDSCQWLKRVQGPSDRPGRNAREWVADGDPFPCHVRQLKSRQRDSSDQLRTVQTYRITHGYRSGLKPHSSRCVLTLRSGRALKPMELIEFKPTDMREFWIACDVVEASPGSESS